MIFDSVDMERLREKYRNLPNYEVPAIVFLDRFDGYEGERSLLEELITKVCPNKQKDWIGRLVNIENQQHFSAWFEIMLFGWLLKFFDVTVEPEIQGNFPDFVINSLDQPLAVEARACLISPEEREINQKHSRVFSALRSIEKPFLVHLEITQFGHKLNTEEFIEKITNWLNFTFIQSLEYRDNFGNIFQLFAEPAPTSRKVVVISSEGLFVNSAQLKSPLREKAKQHKALRNIRHPYIIAIFLEPNYLSAEEVIEAWLGRTTIVVNTETNQVVEEKLDQSGIHFGSHEIRHKSVSGTLVFKAEYDGVSKSRYLRSWYVQNPYANVPINPAIFPSESRFVVVRQDNKFYEMKWVS